MAHEYVQDKHPPSRLHLPAAEGQVRPFHGLDRLPREVRPSDGHSVLIYDIGHLPVIGGKTHEEDNEEPNADQTSEGELAGKERPGTHPDP